MYCKNCGAEIDENAFICIKCGYQNGTGNRYCRNCGNATEKGTGVCTKCGHSPNQSNASGVSSNDFASEKTNEKEANKEETNKKDFNTSWEENAKNIYCKNCGNEMDRNAFICVKCGCQNGVGYKYCQNCGSVTAGAEICLKCGHRQNQAPGYGYGMPQAQSMLKSKMAAGLLGIFLGVWGVHNFYLGYTNKAIAQLLLGTLGVCLFGMGPVASSVWGLVEGILILCGNINKDGKGNPLGE